MMYWMCILTAQLSTPPSPGCLCTPLHSGHSLLGSRPCSHTQHFPPTSRLRLPDPATLHVICFMRGLSICSH